MDKEESGTATATEEQNANAEQKENANAEQGAGAEGTSAESSAEGGDQKQGEGQGEKGGEQKDNHDTRRWNRVLRERAEFKAKAELLERMQMQAQSQAQPEEPPARESFATDEEYIRAVTRFELAHAKPELADMAARTRDSVQTEEVWEEKQDDARKRYSDYDATLENSEATIPEHVEGAIVRSDHGADILYHLGKNPDLARKLSRLPPDRALVELGKIEGTIEANKKRNPKTSSAPPPHAPTGSRGGSAPNLEKVSMSEFARIETERLNKLGRRK